MKNSRDGKQAPSLRREVNTLETHSTAIISTSPILHTLASKSMTQATLLGFLLCLSVCLPTTNLFRSLHHLPKQKTTGSHSQVNLFFFFFFLQAIILHSLLRTNPLIFHQTMIRLLLYPYTSVSNAPKQKI
jgi:hypothetical protein